MTKRTELCREMNPYSDLIVPSAYVVDLKSGASRMVKASEEIGYLLGEVLTASLRRVILTRYDMDQARTTADRNAIALNGGWLSAVEDTSRHHSGKALKLTTRVMIQGTLSTLTVNVEATAGHDGYTDSVVTLVPTVTMARAYCADCASDLVADIPATSYYLAPVAGGTCATCQAVATCSVTMQFHVKGTRTKVERSCGCAPMNLRGVLVGRVADITPSDIVDAIRSLRASVAGGAKLGQVVKAQEQHDSKVLVAANIWTGGTIKRAKVVVDAIAD